MKTPLVSIIIPAYNAERYVCQCLDSILRLAYVYYEVIVVDDGSKDNTALLLDKYASENQHIRVIHKENGGVSTARNAGLEIACGKWITFVDIDDSISPDFLTEDELHSNADLIVKPWNYLNGHNSEIITPCEVSGVELNKILSKYLCYTVFRTPWAKLYRKEIIEQNKIEFNPKYKLGEDNLFVLQYLKHAERICISSSGMYIYDMPRKNKYSLPFNMSFAYMQDFYDVYFSLNIRNVLLVKSMLIWFSSFTIYSGHVDKMRWYNNYKINQLYLHSLSLFGAKIKLITIISRILLILKK